jgi:hypothetical protein
MFVDKLGLHCFMLTGHEIFYNYYKSDRILTLPVRMPGQATPVGLKAIEILKFDENEPNFFEVLLGSDQGHIFHGVFSVDDSTGALDEVQPFKVVL